MGLNTKLRSLALLDGTYIIYMPLPATLVPRAHVARFGYSLSVFPSSILLVGPTDGSHEMYMRQGTCHPATRKPPQEALSCRKNSLRSPSSTPSIPSPLNHFHPHPKTTCPTKQPRFLQVEIVFQSQSLSEPAVSWHIFQFENTQAGMDGYIH